jgi:hypothetical protein
MQRTEPKQAGGNRRSLMKRNVCLCIVALLLSSGFSCLICCGTAPWHSCCRSRRNSSLAIDLLITPKREHLCCSIKGDPSGATLSNYADKTHCCLNDLNTTGSAALSQLPVHRAIASSITLTPARFGHEQSLRLARDRPVMNRGSTHLLCCVLLI